MTLATMTLLTALAAGSGAAPAGVAPKQPPSKVTQAMRLNFAALMTLQPYMASADRFGDPANAVNIRDQLDILQRTPHAFAGSSAKEEPGIAAIAHLFKGYLRGIRRQFEAGQTELARAQLRAASDLCFSCHTRVGADADFQDLDKQVTLLGLAPLEEADLLAATRQFDPALERYRLALTKPVKDEGTGYAWLRAARNALRITVRVKHDPVLTDALLRPLEGRADLPRDLKDAVAGWRRDVDAWKADPFDPATATPEKLVAKARALLGSVDGWLAAELPDIPLSRATRYLHESLARDPRGKQRPQALFLLGLAATGPFDLFLWDLGHLYFEACIRENPATEVARQCFTRLQNDIYFGFTGSSGTHIPPDEAVRLKELRGLAY